MVFQIRRSIVEKYDGKVEPPSWKLTLQATSTDDTIADFNGAIALTDNDKQNTIPITRMAERPTLAIANWVKPPGQFNNLMSKSGMRMNIKTVCRFIIHLYV